MPSKPPTNALPVAALLLGAAMWGVLWYPLRLLESGGLAGLWSTLIIFASATLVGLPVIWLRRRAFHSPGLLLLLAAASGWCNVAFILAVLEGNVVRVLLLFYLSPLWTVLLGMLLLKEHMTRDGWFTLLCAMTGAVIMLWNSDLGFPWPREAADWLAISSGVAFALNNVTVRKIQDAPVEVKAVVAWWGVVALAGLWIAAEGSSFPADAGSAVITGAVALGAIGMVVMTAAVIYGVTHMPVHRSAVILLFELVAGAVSAQWLTDEVVRANEWAGGILIVAAAWFAAHSHTRQAPERARDGPPGGRD